jgi:hypothetical protein
MASSSIEGAMRECLRTKSAMERRRINRQNKPLYDDSAYDMRTQDFVYVGFRPICVPNSLRIYHHDRPVIADVEAAGMIDADAA